VGAADADVVEPAVVAQGDHAGGVDAVGADGGDDLCLSVARGSVFAEALTIGELLQPDATGQALDAGRANRESTGRVQLECWRGPAQSSHASQPLVEVVRSRPHVPLRRENGSRSAGVRAPRFRRVSRRRGAPSPE
jgi:hypothetical protein